VQDHAAADGLVEMMQAGLPVLPEAPLDDPYVIPMPSAP
jgi:hypothetical protein